MLSDRLFTMDVDFIITTQLLEAPCCFYCSLEPPPPVSHSLMVSHTHTLAYKPTHTDNKKVQLLFVFLYLSHVNTHSKPTVHSTLTDACRHNTHKHSFAHVLTHTNLGWLPSCASCFFHQHVFTGRGPLCLHYREAINRKGQPGGFKNYCLGREGGPEGSPNHQEIQPLIKCSAKCQKGSIIFLLMMFSGIYTTWSP